MNQELQSEESKRKQVLNDKNELNQKLIVMEEELYGSKTTQLDLIKQLNILEEKLLDDQDRMREMKQNQGLIINKEFYIGKLDDEVDRALAEYLNKNVDRSNLAISFIRQSPNVYLFGSMRVFLKQDRQD